MDHHNSRDYNIHAFVMCSKNLYDKQSSLGNEYMYFYCNLEITNCMHLQKCLLFIRKPQFFMLTK